MRRFAIRNKVDAIVSLYDSMNYLLEHWEWNACFGCVRNALKENGIFIFDVSTLHNSRVIFKDYVCREKNDVASYLRKSYFNAKTQIQINTFKIKLKKYPYRLFFEEHKQRIWEITKVDELVSGNGFQIMGKYSEFSFLPVDARSERVHYVVKAK